MQLFEKVALVFRVKVSYLVENLMCKQHLTASEVNNAKNKCTNVIIPSFVFKNRKIYVVEGLEVKIK